MRIIGIQGSYIITGHGGREVNPERERAARIARDWAEHYPLEMFHWPLRGDEHKNAVITCASAQASRHAAEQIARLIEQDDEA